MPANGTHFSGEGHLIEAVILGDPNQTVTPIVCDAQGRLVIDLSSATIEIGEVVIIPASTAVNVFATNNSVTSGVETTILSYTNTGISYITQIVGWGTYVGEFLLRINGTIVGGGRTSTAEQTLNISYEAAPISTSLGDTITLTILEYGPGLHQFRCNLLGQ